MNKQLEVGEGEEIMGDTGDTTVEIDADLETKLALADAKVADERRKILRKLGKFRHDMSNLIKKQKRLKTEITELKNEREDLWRERDADKERIRVLEQAQA